MIRITSCKRTTAIFFAATTKKNNNNEAATGGPRFPSRLARRRARLLLNQPQTFHAHGKLQSACHNVSSGRLDLSEGRSRNLFVDR